MKNMLKHRLIKSLRLPKTLVLAVILAMAAGCSSNSQPEVTGEVTLDDHPVEYGVISFVPADGVGPSAQGIIENGKYKLAVPLGAKTVAVEVVGRGAPSPTISQGGAPAPAYQTLSPESQSAPQQSLLRCEISAKTATQNFHLKSS